MVDWSPEMLDLIAERRSSEAESEWANKVDSLDERDTDFDLSNFHSGSFHGGNGWLSWVLDLVRENGYE